jgi:hypothetical protein
MHRWTAAEKAEVLRLRAAGLSWPEIHKRLSLQVSRKRCDGDVLRFGACA